MQGNLLSTACLYALDTNSYIFAINELIIHIVQSGRIYSKSLRNIRITMALIMLKMESYIYMIIGTCYMNTTNHALVKAELFTFDPYHMAELSI